MFGLFKKKQPGDSNMMSDSQAVAMAEQANQGVAMAPTNLVSMPDPIDAPAHVERGLQLKWHVGERIPWKGIWFVVTRVDAGKLELVPERMTFKMKKKLEALS